MKRNNYKEQKISKIVSSKNEPLPYRYPDMYKVYRKFHETYDRDNFILTNGCENALRIALLAIRAKSILIEYPTWQLAELICDSLDIYKYRICYKYNNNEFYINKKDLEKFKTVDALYTTRTYNNLFKHNNIEFESDSKWNIIDETYTADTLINNEQVSENSIIIGSFSKFVDPGMRLGYIIFPEKMRERFNSLREEYICREAAEYILSGQKIENKRHETILRDAICSHFTYITLNKKPSTELPFKTFNVGDREFYRIGYSEDLDKYVN